MNYVERDTYCMLLKNNNFVDLNVENFVEKNTTSVASPPEELPFEVELPENSPRRKNIPEETPFKEVNHPDDEEPSEYIPYEDVIPEDAPPRKNVPEDPPNKLTPTTKPSKKEDGSDDNTPPAQL